MTAHPSELSDSSQSVDVARAAPHPPPRPVPLRTVPSPRERRLLAAVRALQVVVVDEGPAARWLDEEARGAVAGSRASRPRSAPEASDPQQPATVVSREIRGRTLQVSCRPAWSSRCGHSILVTPLVFDRLRGGNEVARERRADVGTSRPGHADRRPAAAPCSGVVRHRPRRTC